jgi:hypothetical protein
MATSEILDLAGRIALAALAVGACFALAFSLWLFVSVMTS